PFLGYVTVDVNLPASAGAVLVPVKDEAAFRKLLGGTAGKVEDEKDGTLRFTLYWPQSDSVLGVKGYARFVHQYAYLTVNDPAARDSQDVSLALRFDRNRLNLTYELTVTPKPGSELGRMVGSIRPTTSLFPQMFGADTAARAVVRVTIPDDLRKLFIPKIEAA